MRIDLFLVESIEIGCEEEAMPLFRGDKTHSHREQLIAASGVSLS